MIRLIALSFGTVTMIGAVLWGLGDKSPERTYNEVSRSEPAPLSLSPAITQNAIVLSQPAQVPATAPVQEALKREVAALPPVRPLARPANLAQKAASLTPAAPAPKPVQPRAGSNDAVTALSYGIIGAFRQPAKPKAEQAPAPVARIPALGAEIASALAAESKANVRTYTVQQGDSLPGIAFRFYGTTVAYLQIISANPDVLADPADLRAGMTLRIPETN